MFDIDSIIQWLQGLPPIGVYAFLWFTTYIENLFPPSPSDVVMLFIATLTGIGTIGFIPAVAVATLGSVMGFLTAFVLGRQFGRRITESGKLPFLTKDSLKKVDKWFSRYGYWVIVANRFLAGTRAVISFFAGMSNLEIATTTILCTVSALAWNALVIGVGKFLGANWRQGETLLRQYGLVVTILLVAIVLYFGIRWFINRKKEKKG
jgi:membrane protein DedA with SNARE-associated domain